jgi:hypothetical protein
MPARMTISKPESLCWYVRRDSPLRKQIDGILVQNDGIGLAQYNDLVSSAKPTQIAPPKSSPPGALGTLRNVLSRIWAIFYLSHQP